MAAIFYFMDWTLDGSWDNPENWDINTPGSANNLVLVPTSANDVYIRAEVLGSTSGACNNMTVELGGILTSGLIAVHGTAVDINNASTVGSGILLEFVGTVTPGNVYLNTANAVFDGSTTAGNLYLEAINTSLGPNGNIAGEVHINATGAWIDGYATAAYVDVPQTYSGVYGGMGPLSSSVSVYINEAVTWNLAGATVDMLDASGWYCNPGGSITINLGPFGQFTNSYLYPASSGLKINVTESGVGWTALDGNTCANFHLELSGASSYVDFPGLTLSRITFSGDSSEARNDMSADLIEFTGTNSWASSSALLTSPALVHFGGQSALCDGTVNNGINLAGTGAYTGSSCIVTGPTVISGTNAVAEYGSFGDIIVSGYEARAGAVSCYNLYIDGPMSYAYFIGVAGTVYFKSPAAVASCITLASNIGQPILDLNVYTPPIKFPFADILGTGLTN